MNEINELEDFSDYNENSNDAILEDDKLMLESFASPSKSDHPQNESPSKAIPEAESGAQSQIPALLRLNTYKAGMDGLDVDRANQLIKIAGTRKGSKFYEHQEKRQKRIDAQIAELRKKAERLDESRRRTALQKADSMLREMEGQRVLNKVIVHFDMDMFFAACEIKANPELADKPMAVGSMSMISTSNYVARKFGVRSAMAGFVAKRLCPSLILIPPHGSLYKKESGVIMSIIQQYDPNPSSASLDEVYINLTDYLFQSYSVEKNVPLESLYDLQELSDDIWEHAAAIVQQIRDEVFAESKLTVSAGISCNTTIAKICTDMNKPNGQFMVKGRRKDVMDFVASLKLRKFPGVGPVRGQMFTGLDINNTNDIFAKRDLIVALFSDLNSYDILGMYLGLGSTNLSNREEYIQKSHSREHTMGDTNKLKELIEILKSLCEQLSRDLKRHSQIGRTITLKLKKSSFEVFLKSRTIPNFTDDDSIIFRTGRELLQNEHALHPEQGYRLIGIKISSLKDKHSAKDQQMSIQQLFTKSSKSNNQEKKNMIHCRLCNEAFETREQLAEHRAQCNGDFVEDDNTQDNHSDTGNDIEPTNNFDDSSNSSAPQDRSSFISTLNNTPNKSSPVKKEPEKAPDTVACEAMFCPICNLNLVFEDNASLNAHIDTCLNRSLCSELTRVQPSKSADPSPSNSSSNLRASSSSLPLPSSTHKKGIKRKRNQLNTNVANNNKGIDSYFEKLPPSLR